MPSATATLSDTRTAPPHPLSRSLAALGRLACEQGWGVAPFEEHRDTHTFTRRWVGVGGWVGGGAGGPPLAAPAPPSPPPDPPTDARAPPPPHLRSSACCRVGRLPEQRAEDALDFRPLLHRDGSVLSAVAPADLQQPE